MKGVTEPPSFTLRAAPVTASSLDLCHPARPGLVHSHVPGAACEVLESTEMVTKAVRARVSVRVSVGRRGHVCLYSWSAPLGEGPEPCPPCSLPEAGVPASHPGSRCLPSSLGPRGHLPRGQHPVGGWTFYFSSSSTWG